MTLTPFQCHFFLTDTDSDTWTFHMDRYRVARVPFIDTCAGKNLFSCIQVYGKLLGCSMRSFGQLPLLRWDVKTLNCWFSKKRDQFGGILQINEWGAIGAGKLEEEFICTYYPYCDNASSLKIGFPLSFKLFFSGAYYQIKSPKLSGAPGQFSPGGKWGGQ